jgi:glyoxylase-like metal-dependent hydrolase (beta-lactamase superfamily II)
MRDGVLCYTGGELATNAYLVPLGDRYLCFDAPEGTAEWLERSGHKILALILTHGHFDHIWDAARVEEQHNCPVYAHKGDEFMIRDTSLFKIFGIPQDIPPVRKLELIELPEKGAGDFKVCGEKFRAFHIPGHSPGSVAFYHAKREIVLGGDVLFAGGVGRWDLPGGSQETLIAGIKKHLLHLPPMTIVYPGHGGPTTIGAEKEMNPYLL